MNRFNCGLKGAREFGSGALAELCAEIAPFGGVYVTHMRGYSPTRFDLGMSVALNVGRRAGCAVHISHFNVLAAQGIAAVDSALAEGLDVTFDLYPYLYGSTTLADVNALVGTVALCPGHWITGSAASVSIVGCRWTRK